MKEKEIRRLKAVRTSFCLCKKVTPASSWRYLSQPLGAVKISLSTIRITDQKNLIAFLAQLPARREYRIFDIG